MQNASENGLQFDSAIDAPHRAAYATPALRVLGTLADLTATGSKNGKEHAPPLGNLAGNKP